MPELSAYRRLSLGYGAAVGLAALTARDPERTRRALDPLPLSVATFAAAKAISNERIGRWVRRAARERHPALGELASCSRCTGTWVALSLATLRYAHPSAGRWATGVLVASAGNDLAQCSFKLLCEIVNRLEDQ